MPRAGKAGGAYVIERISDSRRPSRLPRCHRPFNVIGFSTIRTSQNDGASGATDFLNVTLPLTSFRKTALYKKPRISSGFMVGDTGIEPVTSSVSGKRAPAAPIALARWVRDSNPCTRLCRPLPRLSANPPCEPKQLPILRADDGTRTRDPHLGKVMLYQLSHIRISVRAWSRRRSLTIDRPK